MTNLGLLCYMEPKNNPNRFDELINAAPSASAIYHTRDIIITSANAQMLAFWGKGKEVIGKPLIEAVPELKGQPFITLLQNVFDTGITHHAERDLAELVVDGRLQTFYFNYTYKPVAAPDGKTEFIFHTAIDVTALIKTQQELSDTQERLNLALQAAEIGTWDLNPLSHAVHWDQRCRELFGFEGEADIAYHQVLDCIHPEDKPKVMEAVAAAINPLKTDTYDIRYRTVGSNSGTLRWVHCKGRSYFNKEGLAYRFAGTARDITNEVNTSLSQQQLLSLVSHNADIMTIADLQGNLIYMNRAGRELFGVPDEVDLTKMTASDFYEPEELKRVQETIIPKIDSEKGWKGILHLKHVQTHEAIPCQVNYILVKNPFTGEIIGRGSTARDLRGELKSRAELQRLATIVEFSEDFCNYTDWQGNTIYLNAAGQKLIGLSVDDVAKTNIEAYHSFASNRLIKGSIRAQLLETGKWSGRLELKHQQTGEIIPIHKQFFLIRDSLTAEPIAITGIARDLTAEMNAKKAMDKKNSELAHTLKELAFLANAVPIVMWTATPDGMLDFINQRWLDQSAMPIQSSLGDKWTATMHPDDVARTLKTWQKSLATGEPYQAEFRLKDKYGNYRWWLVRAVALTDSNGHIIKWYGSNTDISEQKELQRQKDNFLGVASHELKTPVTSIKAYAQVVEMMLHRAGDEKNAALIGKMNNQINRLTALIGDLLDVTKINSGKLAFTNTHFNFDQLVNEIVEDIQLTAEKHQIQLKLKSLRDIHGDRERIQQVIVNLITNAVKYSPDANRIIVFTEDHGHEVQLCVQDFGIGLPPDKKDLVFEQFYRVSGTKEHTFPGLGLGLYISSEIVKQLGGRIWVNSIAGKGSTFCFAIPVVQALQTSTQENES
ncbi:PAS domain S-box protein [Pedobacter chitinilyticus]|nr:PAS domain S-box protein [Pedobacter chitinilyticus]